MLSFELTKGVITNGPVELELLLDAEGLNSLLAQLRFLVEGKTDHVHLMCEEWGGSHLGSHASAPTNVLIQHVKILLV